MADNKLFQYLKVASLDPLGLPGFKDQVRLRAKLSVFVSFAEELANLSACARLKVGCALVTPDFNEVVAIGYNGPPSGEPNDSCRGIPGGCGCTHCESNALVKRKSDRDNLVMIVTDSPCEHCAGLIVNSRVVSAVIYDREYRDVSGLARLKNAGILVVRKEIVLCQ